MIPPPTRRQRGRFGVPLAIALFAALLVLAAATPAGRRLLAELARPTAPERGLGSPKLRSALVASGELALQPPGAQRNRAHSGIDTDNGDCPDIEIGPRAASASELPSSTSIDDAALADPTTLISIWLDPCRASRLHAQPELRGRETEETGWVTLFEKGEIRFASAAGVRIHGGVSRKNPPYNYRLYFRPAYGAPGAPASLLFEALHGSVARLTVSEVDDLDRDRTPFPFPGEVAADIGRHLGAIVPSSRPVRLSMNGEPPRAAVASEHISGDFLSRRFGHDDFDLVRGKREVKGDEESLFRAELAWIETAPAPLLSSQVDERYDLESLLNWLVTVVYCGTGDLYQDALVRDRTGDTARGRWFWIHWDHDMSFRTPPENSRFGRFSDAFPAIVWSARPTDISPARSLLQRLLAEDPLFRQRVEERFERALTAELTPVYLEQLVAHYESEARRFGFTDLHFAGALRTYFASRTAAVRAQVAEVLAAFEDETTSRPPGLRRRGSRRNREP